MINIKIFIDTELWIFAQKVPDNSKFVNNSDFKKALELHKQSSEFIKQKINEDRISMTYHQLCEIYHVLGFRGMRLPHEFVQTYCFQLIHGKFMDWYQITPIDIEQAINFSKQSGIHIWDYLCVLPLYKEVEILYTCDAHFKHASFQSLGPIIKNPLKDWIGL